MTRNSYISDPANSPSLKIVVRTLLTASLVVALLIALFAFLQKESATRSAKIDQQKSSILSTLEITAKEIESIRQNLGRAPTDGRELVQLPRHPLPAPLGRQILYRRTAENSYDLAYPVEWIDGFSGDYLVFHSDKPAAGWTVFYD